MNNLKVIISVLLGCLSLLKPLMASIRQEKISELIKRELSVYFQQNARTIAKGAMVTVTIVRVSKDLSVAKVYLSIFGGSENNEKVLSNIKQEGVNIRYSLAKLMRNQLRQMPEFHFYLDDSLDYAEEIDGLLNNK
jgi:ribosome-binding factor A